MRRAENRASTAARQARRSSLAAQVTAATASSVVEVRNPVAPWSTISGAAPRGVVMTGVPQARGLDHVQPEGFVPADGVEQRPGGAEESSVVGGVDLADVVDVAAEERLDLGPVVLVLVGVAHLGGDGEGDAGALGDLDGLADALVGGHAPDEDQVVAAGTDRVAVRRRCRGG